MRRNDAVCEAHARSPERPLRSMGLYSHSANKRQPRPGPSSQSLDISDYVGGVLVSRAVPTPWADAQMRFEVHQLARFIDSRAPPDCASRPRRFGSGVGPCESTGHANQSERIKASEPKARNVQSSSSAFRASRRFPREGAGWRTRGLLRGERRRRPFCPAMQLCWRAPPLRSRRRARS